jgi:hypothetical protein
MISQYLISNLERIINISVKGVQCAVAAVPTASCSVSINIPVGREQQNILLHLFSSTIQRLFLSSHIPFLLSFLCEEFNDVVSVQAVRRRMTLE